MIVLAILFGVVLLGGLVTALIAKGTARSGGIGAAVLGLIGAIIFGALSSGYAQDPGTAVVTRSFTGAISGSTTSAGWHLKNPFDSTIEFDTRNQQELFAASATGTDGQQVQHGAEITVTDADGVSSNIDIAVSYSIDPNRVVEIYKQYQSAENYKSRYVEQSIRSAVREVPNSYHTLDLITKRSDLENGIRQAIQNKWSAKGSQGDALSIENVSLQDVRVPDSVKDSYAAAQKAQIAVTTEKNNLEAAQVQAQQQVVQAKAQAQANKELEKSLTPNVLKQHTLDTMAKLAASGNLVITDGTGSTLINAGKR